MRTLVGVGTGFLASCSVIYAGTAVLKPVADTTLFAYQPNNNNGKGTTLIVGGLERQSPTPCRSLVRFDLGTSVPAGSIITNVSIKLAVTRERGSSGPIQTGFHRLLRDWTEGAKNNPGGGSPATAGEATWNSRSKGTADWSAPGGAGDFAATPSATIALDNTGSYTIASTPELIADVQAWLADPSTSRGWMLLAPQETTPSSARRLAARENPSQAITLTVGFTTPPPPAVPPVASAQVAADGFFEVSFPATAGVRYGVQRRSELDATPWVDAATFAPSQDGVLTHRVAVGTAPEFIRIIVKP